MWISYQKETSQSPQLPEAFINIYTCPVKALPKQKAQNFLVCSWISREKIPFMNLLSQTTLKPHIVSFCLSLQYRSALCFILLTDWEWNLMFTLTEPNVFNTSICIKINISFPGLANRESANVIFHVYHAIKAAVCVFNQFRIWNLLVYFIAFDYAILLCEASEGILKITNLIVSELTFHVELSCEATKGAFSAEANGVFESSFFFRML